MNIPLKENERLDDLQNGYHIIQNTRDFCYGIDAVLLSDFARVKKGEQALDLGTGTGIIPILLKAKTQGEHFTGLEIQEQSALRSGRYFLENQTGLPGVSPWQTLPRSACCFSISQTNPSIVFSRSQG